MQVVLLDEAQRRFEAEDDWWREHRDATELFVDEFAQALERLTSMPGACQRYRVVHGKLILRVLMKKTGYHVYDFHDHERDLIEIHSICGGTPRTRPALVTTQCSAQGACGVSLSWIAQVGRLMATKGEDHGGPGSKVSRPADRGR